MVKLQECVCIIIKKPDVCVAVLCIAYTYNIEAISIHLTMSWGVCVPGCKYDCTGAKETEMRRSLTIRKRRKPQCLLVLLRGRESSLVCIRSV